MANLHSERKQPGETPQMREISVSEARILRIELLILAAIPKPKEGPYHTLLLYALLKTVLSHAAALGILAGPFPLDHDLKNRLIREVNLTQIDSYILLPPLKNSGTFAESSLPHTPTVDWNVGVPFFHLAQTSNQNSRELNEIVSTRRQNDLREETLQRLPFMQNTPNTVESFRLATKEIEILYGDAYSELFKEIEAFAGAV